jgi:hypothetical protein
MPEVSGDERDLPQRRLDRMVLTLLLGLAMFFVWIQVAAC